MKTYTRITYDEALALRALNVKVEGSWTGAIWFTNPGSVNRESWRTGMSWRVETDGEEERSEET